MKATQSHPVYCVSRRPILCKDSRMENNSWVELERATNIAEAEVIRSFLQSHDIETLIPDEHTARNMHYLTPMLGFVRIQVREADLAIAQELLLKMRITLADEHQPEPYAHTEDGDGLALRASRSAIFGLLMLPLVLNLYSVFMMWQCLQKRVALSAKGKRHFVVAFIFNVIAIFAWGLFIYNGGFLSMMKQLLGIHV